MMKLFIEQNVDSSMKQILKILLFIKLKSLIEINLRKFVNKKQDGILFIPQIFVFLSDAFIIGRNTSFQKYKKEVDLGF